MPSSIDYLDFSKDFTISFWVKRNVVYDWHSDPFLVIADFCDKDAKSCVGIYYANNNYGNTPSTCDKFSIHYWRSDGVSDVGMHNCSSSDAYGNWVMLTIRYRTDNHRIEVSSNDVLNQTGYADSFFNNISLIGSTTSMTSDYSMFSANMNPAAPIS